MYAARMTPLHFAFMKSLHALDIPKNSWKMIFRGIVSLSHAIPLGAVQNLHHSLEIYDEKARESET